MIKKYTNKEERMKHYATGSFCTRVNGDACNVSFFSSFLHI